MRISDWSSDVCSSDLLAFRAARGEGAAGLVTGVEEPERHRDDVGFELHQTREGLPAQRVLREIEVEGLPRYLQQRLVVVVDVKRKPSFAPVVVAPLGVEQRPPNLLPGAPLGWKEIGRASCRERGCQYV